MLKYLFFIVLISTYILGDSKTIVFAPLPTKDTQELHTQFLPLVDFLEKKLNVKIKIDYNSDYEKLLAKFINKDMNMLLLWLILKTAKVKFRTLALL
jgi:phosphonate transport system substrate-binding protein